MNRYVIAFADKVVLAGFALWLTGAASGLVTRAADDQTRADLAAALVALDAHMASSTLEAARAPNWTTALRLSLDPASVDAAFLFPAWVLERRPGFLFDVPAPPPLPPFLHGAATDVVADAGVRGRITVRWQPPTSSNVLLTCRLERRTGEGAWEPIADDLTPATCERVDEAVRARTRYAYRVVSRARLDDEDPHIIDLRRRGALKGLDPAVVTRESDPSLAVDTPDDLFVVPRSVQVDALRPEAATAYVMIHRWDARAGRFVARGFALRVGDRVGAGEHDTGAILEAVGEAGGALWVELRDVATGEVRTEDSRRDRLPPELRPR